MVSNVQRRRIRLTRAMHFKLRRPDARRCYARRVTVVESVSSPLKDVRGFTGQGLQDRP